MRTKWEILSAQLEKARAEVERLESYMSGMEKTPDNTKCTGCDEQFVTNADFAKHFVIPNESHLNLGECPNIKRCCECGSRMRKNDPADFCSKACTTAWFEMNPANAETE